MLVFVKLVMFIFKKGLWFVPIKQVKANMKFKFGIYGLYSMIQKNNIAHLHSGSDLIWTPTFCNQIYF